MNNDITINGSSGVRISGRDNNRIVNNTINANGGAESGDQSNLFITQSSYNILQGNSITNGGRSERGFVAPEGLGVSISGGCCTTIGGVKPALGKSISGNQGGIEVQASPAAKIRNNVVQSNGFGVFTNSDGGFITDNHLSNNLAVASTSPPAPSTPSKETTPAATGPKASTSKEAPTTY